MRTSPPPPPPPPSPQPTSETSAATDNDDDAPCRSRDHKACLATRSAPRAGRVDLAAQPVLDCGDERHSGEYEVGHTAQPLALRAHCAQLEVRREHPDEPPVALGAGERPTLDTNTRRGDTKRLRFAVCCGVVGPHAPRLQCGLMSARARMKKQRSSARSSSAMLWFAIMMLSWPTRAPSRGSCTPSR